VNILHVGCGGDSLPTWLGSFDKEVSLDIDPQHKPDIVASITDMGDIGTYDALYCCHCLEHLYPQDVPVALSEFRRVLKPEGIALIIVPDLEDVKATDDVVYESPGGPITGRDMIYGATRCVAVNLYMAHHTGFVSATWEKALVEAGFSRVQIIRAGGYNLIASATK
jgi:SAM-dependent methyltransferase